MASSHLERRLAAILSADVAGYSRLMEHDEDATVRTLSTYRDAITLLIRQNRGRLVDFPGDNALAEFPSAQDAVHCAVEVQRVLGGRNTELRPERRMEFRIGVHLGDIRSEGERIYGDGVNLAARLRELAEPGGICISGAVHDQVEGKLELSYADLGKRSVKNIFRPVRVYAVVPEVPAAGGPTPDSHRGPEPARSGEIRSIAVLPFENLSSDLEQEYFADGMTEALIGDLAKIRSLRVVSRTSVMAYKGARKPLPQIGRELNAEAIIEGSVVREGERIRVTAQLIDARTDYHIWVDRYERDARGVLALQREIARTVARRIQLELTPREEAQLAGPLGRWSARIHRLGVPED